MKIQLAAKPAPPTLPGRPRARRLTALIALAALGWTGLSPVLAQSPPPAEPAVAAQSPLPESSVRTRTNHAAPAGDTLLKLGPGDSISVQVYGRPELNTATYVAEDGTITMPLAGTVQVAGYAPAQAAERVAATFRQGGLLVNPQVTIFLVQYRSQQISVLGEVKTPGRYPLESKTTIFDLLAQAGGTTENGGAQVVLLRTDRSGVVVRRIIDLDSLNGAGGKAAVPVALKGGDSVFVPRAELYSIYGEVRAPNRYRLEPGMTVVEAIARGGGVTPRGSERRIVIGRRGADGKYVTGDAELGDAVHANDVIRVKERIF